MTMTNYNMLWKVSHHLAYHDDDEGDCLLLSFRKSFLLFHENDVVVDDDDVTLKEIRTVLKCNCPF